MLRNSTIAILLVVAAALLAHSRGSLDTPSEPDPEVTMTVRSCSDGVGPGTWLLLACTFEIPKGWHIYWKNPGAAGAATRIQVDVPEGFVVKPVVYPRPKIIPDPVGTTYGYENRVTLLLPVYPPPAGVVANGDDERIIPLKVSANWLVCCREKCFIGQAQETLQVRWHDVRQPLEPWASKMLAEPWWPRALTERPRTTAGIQGDKLVIEGPATQSDSMGFLPDSTPGVEMGAPHTRTENGRFRMEVPFTVRPQDTLGQAPLARGLLIFGDKATMSAYDVSVPVPGNRRPPGPRK